MMRYDRTAGDAAGESSASKDNLVLFDWDLPDAKTPDF